MAQEQVQGHQNLSQMAGHHLFFDCNEVKYLDIYQNPSHQQIHGPVWDHQNDQNQKYIGDHPDDVLEKPNLHVFYILK